MRAPRWSCCRSRAAGVTTLTGEVTVRRAVRPHRLQRPVRRPAGLSRHEDGGSDRGVVACGALAQPTSAIAARRRGRSTSTRCRRCCTTGPSASPARWRRTATALRRPYRRVAWATPTAAPTARWTRCAASSGSPGWRGCTATTCTAGPGGSNASSTTQPGTYVLTDFLVRSFARTVLHRARPGPAAGAARRLLRPLHAGGVADPGARRRAAAAGRGAPRSGSACHSPWWRPATPVWSERWPQCWVDLRSAAGAAGRCARPRSRRSG